MTDKNQPKTRCIITFKDSDAEIVSKLFAVMKALGHSAPIHFVRAVTISTYNDLVTKGLIEPKK